MPPRAQAFFGIFGIWTGDLQSLPNLSAREGPRQAGIVRGVRSSQGGVQGAGVRPRWRDYRDFFGVE